MSLFDPLPGETAAPAASSDDSAAPDAGPLSGLAAIATGARNKAGSAVGNVVDLLDRPRQTVQATLTGGLSKTLPTLMHGQSREGSDQTRDELRGKLGLNASRADMPQWQQGVEDFALDTVTDPTMLVGGVLGLGEKALAASGRAALPAFARGVEALSKSSSAQGRKAAQIAAGGFDTFNYKGAVQRSLASKYGAKGLDYFAGLKAINNARLTKGADLGSVLSNEAQRAVEGLDAADKDAVYKAVHMGTVAQLPEHLKPKAQQFSMTTDALAYLSGTRALRENLTKGERVTQEVQGPVNAAAARNVGPKSEAQLNAEYQEYIEQMRARGAKISPEQAEQGRAPFIERRRGEPSEPSAPNAAPALPPVTTREGGGFELSDPLKRFDTSVRSLQRPTQYRKNYVPTAHDLTTPLGLESKPGSIAELDARVMGEVHDTRSLLEAQNSSRDLGGASTTRGLKPEDANLLERSDHAVLLDPEMQEKVVEARLRSGAKAIAARDAEREVSRLFGVGGFSKAPAPAKAFFQETYTTEENKSFWQHLGDAVRTTTDVPKQGLFALPFRHMANIGTLSIFADPTLANVYGTAGRFARLLSAGADEGKRAEILGDSGRYGVTGTSSLVESGAQSDSGWVGKIPLLGDLYKTSTHVLWSFDDAAKATRFQRLQQLYRSRGLKESDASYRAANQVGAELIDYGNKSPFTQALSYIAPFATYRSKLPGAIGRTLATHPERLNLVARASPGLAGAPVDSGDGRTTTVKSPLTDVLELGDSPAKFARSTIGPPGQLLGSLAGLSMGTRNPHFLTYGANPDLKYIGNSALGDLPLGIGGQAADLLHINEFSPQGYLDQLVGSNTGVYSR